jgi:hypothetical protein
MKFTITITKDVIDKSITCGVRGLGDSTAKNLHTSCAFAVAYNELVPLVYVETGDIYFYGRDNTQLAHVYATREQTKFIETFDSMNRDSDHFLISDYFYMNRYKLVGRQFEVEVPDNVIEYWYPNIQQAIDKILASSSLKLV